VAGASGNRRMEKVHRTFCRQYNTSVIILR
jgi:hypothetical protein